MLSLNIFKFDEKLKKMPFKPLLFLSMIALASCSSNSPDDLTERIIIPETVTYTNDVRPIIEDNCIMCHQEPPLNGAPMPLIDYAKVKQAVQDRGLIGRISKAQGDPDMMPFGGTRLQQEKIDLIIKWRDQGFIN